MARFWVFLSGLVFGAGLGISGMTLPSKVTGFLDLAGEWDPSLALVMVGAIGVHVTLRWVVSRRSAPLFAPRFYEPGLKQVDARLVIGATLFGVGWGLGGYCPGPAIVGLSSGSIATLVFVGAMITGMLIEHATRSIKAPAVGEASPLAEVAPAQDG